MRYALHSVYSEFIFEILELLLIYVISLFVIKLEDPTDLPDAILAVVGKTFTFGIAVEKEHVLYGSEIYKVGKIYRESQIVFTESANFESSESDQDLALTSGEEV